MNALYIDVATYIQRDTTSENDCQKSPGSTTLAGVMNAEEGESALVSDVVGASKLRFDVAPRALTNGRHIFERRSTTVPVISTPRVKRCAVSCIRVVAAILRDVEFIYLDDRPSVYPAISVISRQVRSTDRTRGNARQNTSDCHIITYGHVSYAAPTRRVRFQKYRLEYVRS